MKPIITDCSSLEIFNDEGAVYVDKTAQLYRLIKNKTSRNFFLSRPRRFGKSLMISTLEEIFKGNRKLFKGLAIDSEEYDWKKYPILRFDFSNVSTLTVEDFKVSLAANVSASILKAGLEYDKDISVGDNFSNAITKLANGQTQSVVLLIDEYDAPIAHALKDLEKADWIRAILSEFYINIKHHNASIRFMMMTGVSKFTQLSIFSALSNLTDLTYRREAVDLVGYTEQELEHYFKEDMLEHAAVMGLTYDEYLKNLRRWCDGYRFSPFSQEKMYNPYTIANTLVMRLPIFTSTWAKTGRPSFIGNYFKREELIGRDFDNIEGVTTSIFDAADLHALQPETILYQAGYLTITEGEGQFFTLGIPNQEIREDLNTFLLELEAGRDRSMDRDQISYVLMRHDFAKFEKRLTAFYASLPYGSKEEKIRKNEFSYARIFIALLKGAGYELRPEDTITCGRPDLVAKHPSGVYIFEFKVDESADAAIAQIHDRNYPLAYNDGTCPVYAIGLNFDSVNGRLIDVKIEEIH